MKISFVLLLVLCTGRLIAQHGQVFPQPMQMEENTKPFVCNGELYLEGNEDSKTAHPYFSRLFEKEHGISLTLSGPQKATIILQKINTFVYSEGYQLLTNDKGISIQYSSYQSLCNALQTLNQLIRKDKTIPGVHISDQPAYSYRGVHLDCSRHFFTIEELKGFLDQIARLKFNRFHWHLTDDQGWRIEIKKYPLLTNVGAWRDSTLIGHFSNNPIKYDHRRYGGFYTQDQAKELVEYARVLGIEIVPEIEMPGHARAALAAYPKLSCSEEFLPVAGTWGVFEEVFCSQEKTRSFLKDVLDEVMAIFPSPVIHIGGDECPKVKWEKCPKCKAVMEANNLHSTHELQSFFIHDIEKHVNAKGKTIIGWDEILEGGLAPNAQVMSWQGVEGGIAAAKENHKVVMTPMSHCYFDYYQSGDIHEPLAIGGYLPLEKVYQFDPVQGFEGLSGNYVLGGQANMWTEYLPTMNSVKYQLFPRLVAMSEVLWTGDRRKSYREFVQGLIEYQFPYFDAMHIPYSKACLDPKLLFSPSEKGLILEAITDIEGARATIVFPYDEQVQKGLKIYDLENVKKEAVAQFMDTTSSWLLVYPSSLYSTDFTINVTKNNQLLKSVNYAITPHLALGKTVVFETPPNEKYNVNGNLALTDGIWGLTSRWKGNEWLGFTTDTVSFQLDLGKKTTLRSIELGYLNDPGSWIYSPHTCVVAYSKDGRNWENAKPTSKTDRFFRLEQKLKTRYLKITTINNEKIPEGMTGAGFTPWTFLGELIISR